ncbi:MAG: thioredoxin-like domain-containing protein [Verrucomicrobiales bacterium]
MNMLSTPWHNATTIISALSALLLAITTSVSSAETKKPEGKPESLADLLPEKLQDSRGNVVDRDSLEGKLIGVYFSAEWCPPCRDFTPDLVRFRNINKDKFEVVFVSSDKSADDQQKYMRGYRMQWPALEHGSEEAMRLKSHFSVQGIPKLVILDDQGRLVTSNGRGELSSNPRQALATWQTAAEALAAN